MDVHLQLHLEAFRICLCRAEGWAELSFRVVAFIAISHVSKFEDIKWSVTWRIPDACLPVAFELAVGHHHMALAYNIRHTPE